MSESPAEAVRDRALEIAQAEFHRYGRMSRRSIRANLVSESLLLMTTAATTVTAGLGASPLVTAPLAAVSVLLTGARSANDWNSLAISRTNAHEEMRAAIYQYEVGRGQQGHEQAGLNLVERINAIAAAERASWAKRRQKASKPRDDT